MNYCTKDRLTREKCFLLVPLASIGHSPLIKAEHYSFVPLVITSVFSRKMMGKPKVLQVTPISEQTCRYALSSWHSMQDVIFSNFSCELVPGIQVQHKQFCSSAEIGSVLESLWIDKKQRYEKGELAWQKKQIWRKEDPEQKRMR